MLNLSPNTLNLNRKPDSGDNTPRRMLSYFFVFRLLVSCLLTLLWYTGTGPSLLGQTNPDLYVAVLHAYLGIVLAGGLLLRFDPSISADKHAILMMVTDICCVVLLMHGSGGVRSGLGMLLAVSIAISSLVTPGLTALLSAALASLGILSEQIYSQFILLQPQTAYTQAGLLGASFFAIALLAHVLSLRLKESEELVSQHAIDLANLGQLNKYIIGHMQTGIVVVDTDQAIRLMNESAWHLLGMPEAQPGAPLEQASQTLADRYSQWLDNHNLQPSTLRPIPNGRELSPSFSRLGGTLNTGTVIFLEDAAAVTQQAQQLKLASLGRLTASIAHEIRNPLGAISHAEQLLSESNDLQPADHRLLRIIGDNSKRVNEIIENVLSLSRRGTTRPEPLELEKWLKEFIFEFATQAGLAPHQIQMQIDPEETIVRVDPSHFHQILTNICENAVEHFELRPEKFLLKIAGGHNRDSGSPFLEILDNGKGINPEVARQMFEPFFTTQNSGTGLGLYIAKELSESNRLRLDYSSPPSGGSCFRISFPSFITYTQSNDE
jgi:two-component system sensor histidine kinase PilS (NtrC family)